MKPSVNRGRAAGVRTGDLRGWGPRPDIGWIRTRPAEATRLYPGPRSSLLRSGISVTMVCRSIGKYFRIAAWMFSCVSDSARSMRCEDPRAGRGQAGASSAATPASSRSRAAPSCRPFFSRFLDRLHVGCGRTVAAQLSSSAITAACSFSTFSGELPNCTRGRTRIQGPATCSNSRRRPNRCRRAARAGCRAAGSRRRSSPPARDASRTRRARCRRRRTSPSGCAAPGPCRQARGRPSSGNCSFRSVSFDVDVPLDGSDATYFSSSGTTLVDLE